MLRVLVLGLLALHSVSGQACTYSKALKAGEIFEFTSPGYKSNYAKGLSCSWTITAPVGNQVAVQCPDFNVPASPNCANDVFTLNTLKYCSTGLVSAKSPSNKMVATLKTTTNTGKFYCKATSVPNACECGRRKTPKIVGGVEAGVHEFPYQAYIRSGTGPTCSATIISPEYVMTAAHCVARASAGSIKVVVGDHDTSVATETATTVIHDVAEIKVHENYNSATNKNDIALIRLTKPIEYNDDVGPVCLPFKLLNQNLAGKPVTLAGWGTTGFGEPMAKKLQKVDVTVTTDAVCKQTYPTADSTNLCTYGDDKDACQNDSGGSVYYTDSGRVYSIGVISGGIGCGTEAGLATRVTSFLSWIKSKAVGQTFCNQ